MAATARKQRKQPAAAISAADAKRAQNSSYIPLKIRFKAWWEGVDAEKLMLRQGKARRRKSSAEIRIDQPTDDLDANKTDFELLMSVRERVWGDHQIVPGSPDYLGSFLDCAKLKPGTVLLDLAAGLGGCGRSIALQLDAVVEGFETDEAVAKMGAARAAHLALDKQAPISHYKAHNPFLRVDRYDCAFAHELFFRILDKANLFTEVHKSLKEKGNFVFSDLIYNDPEAEETKAIKDWAASEKEVPDPWTEECYKSELARIGFEVVTFKDETALYQGMIREGWEAFAGTLDDRTINRRFVDIMMHEAKIWQCRTAAIKAGHLRFLRVHARRM